MSDPGDDFLSLLDLTEYEAAALEELLLLGRTTAPDLAEATGIPKARIYGVLDSLAEAGYVKVIPGRPKRYQPHDPSEIAERAVANRRHAYERFREDVEATPGRDPAPITPANFTRDLLEAMESQADRLEDLAAASGDSGLEAAVTDLTAALSEDLAECRAALGGEEQPTDDVVIALLAVDFASLYHRTCRIPTDFEEALSADDRAAVRRLATQLELLDVSREHYKQLFTRESLSNLSRIVLYVGVPVEAVAVLVLLRFTGLFGADPTGLSPVAVYAAAVLGLAPLAVVFSYVLRAATIARRTATTTQFQTNP